MDRVEQDEGDPGRDRAPAEGAACRIDEVPAQDTQGVIR
jgi:hypothetical protein